MSGKFYSYHNWLCEVKFVSWGTHSMNFIVCLKMALTKNDYFVLNILHDLRSIRPTGRQLLTSKAGAGVSCKPRELSHKRRGFHLINHLDLCGLSTQPYKHTTIRLQGRLSKKAYLGLVKHCPLLHRINLSTWNLPR